MFSPMQTTVTITGTTTETPRLTSDDGIHHAQVQVTVPGRYLASGGWRCGPIRSYTVAAVGQLAEHLATSLRAGDRVIVRGRLRALEGADSAGATCTVWEITAADVAVSMHPAPIQIIRAASSRPTS